MSKRKAAPGKGEPSQPKPRWDHVLKALLALPVEIARCAQLIEQHSKKARGCVYDFIVAYAYASQEFHNEVLDHCRETGKSIGDWFDELWGPAELFIRDRKGAIEAVHNGMSRKEFCEQSPSGWLLAHTPKKTRKGSATTSTTTCPVPPEPDVQESLSPEETTDRWRARAMALGVALKAARDELKVVQGELRALKQRVAVFVVEEQQRMKALKRRN